MADTVPDAITLLKADHREVEHLFKKFEDAKGDGAKKNIAEQICVALIVHTKLENEHFYPACEGKVDKADLAEAYVEHDAASVLIAEILKGGPSDEYYDAKVKVLNEEITHHVKEEERWITGLFSEAKRHGVDMGSLGEEMTKAKVRYQADVAKNGAKVTLEALTKTKVAGASA